jgi:regulator of protease activity HflC (stomatin/prohibitin superfamily)
MEIMDMDLFLLIAIAAVAALAVSKAAVIVPQQSVYIVERLGKFNQEMKAGFHLLIPFLDVIVGKVTLKEQVIEIPEQSVFTQDNISMTVEAVMYIQVTDPQQAVYGVSNYIQAAQMLAQTTVRSVIGKIELDKTFEEREKINGDVVMELDKATAAWGIKVLRYEIAEVQVPNDVKTAMEAQVRAERERRERVARATGVKEAKVLESEGQRIEMENLSEGEKTRQINEAEGKAREIEALADATAHGIRAIAEAIKSEGGSEAVSLRIAEQYVDAFKNLAKENNTLILPAELSNIGGAVAGLSTILSTGALTPNKVQ